MGPSRPRRVVATLAAAASVVALAVSAAPASAEEDEPPGVSRQKGVKPWADAIANARTAPYGSVPAGEYSEALGSLRGLPSNGSRWSEVTTKPYDADDPRYRDPQESNSGGGARVVAGRITGVAAGNGYLFAAGADGGVFRQRVGTNTWQPLSESILSLSTGDLVYDEASDTLWYATGEANTGATSYTGAGVYRLRNATTAAGFTDADRVGSDELESRGINQLKFDGRGMVYAATTRGLWRHATAESQHAQPWQVVLLPNPASDENIKTPYDNIVNDVVFQPGSNGGTVMANVAWRNGAAYNGMYLSTRGGAPGSFAKIAVTGDVDNSDIGNGEFDVSADGKRIVLVLESPKRLGSETALQGVFTSAGDVRGPWKKVATSVKLANSGSALSPDPADGYAPGVQAWYNNFVLVDPADRDHFYVGLEEVFETNDGGATFTTPGPYWNFGFACFDASKPGGGCPATTHPDQHSVAISGGRLYVGNDGGVYSRPNPPRVSRENKAGHATDWRNHNANLRTLQYYSVGVGKVAGGYSVAGGLQDNGGSLLLPGARTMVSPFGGDGGDIIVNPRNGCEILDEYVYLTLWLTKNCGNSTQNPDPVFDVSVPDVNARFTAPFRAVRGSKNTRDGDSERWVAGGNSVWSHDLAFSYTKAEANADPKDGNGWRKRYTLDATGSRLVVGLDAVADPKAPRDASKDVIYAAWCGEVNCNSESFSRGVATNFGGAWHELDMTGLPNRYPSNVAVDPSDPTGSTVYLVFNGFNRRWIEGPGAGTKHVFRGTVRETASGGVRVAWTDLSKGFPDVPATDVLVVGRKLVVGTDLGVLVAPDKDADATTVTWRRVGPNSGQPGAIPLTTVFDIHEAPDGYLYAATHGRGIWRTRLSEL